MLPVGNPLAVRANVRYVESDMNRQFLLKDILDREKDINNENNLLEKKDNDNNNDSSSDNIINEKNQAIKLNNILGPKNNINKPYGYDYIIDLHSSNSNIGLMGMVNAADNDCHSLRLSKYLLNVKKKNINKDNGINKTTNNTNNDNDNTRNMSIMETIVESINTISAINLDENTTKNDLLFPDLKFTTSKYSKVEGINVDTLSPYGIAFEVGEEVCQWLW